MPEVEKVLLPCGSSDCLYADLRIEDRVHVILALLEHAREVFLLCVLLEKNEFFFKRLPASLLEKK